MTISYHTAKPKLDKHLLAILGFFEFLIISLPFSYTDPNVTPGTREAIIMSYKYYYKFMS
jgi:hypothetical protein